MIRTSLLLMAVVAVLYSCSADQPQAQQAKNSMQQKQINIVAGEYLVTLDKDVHIEDIKKQLSVYGPKVVKDLGRGRYLMRLEQDPGLDALKKLDCFKKSACKIQHNFKYKPSGNSSLTKVQKLTGVDLRARSFK